MKDNENLKALEWCEQFENNVVMCGKNGEKFTYALQMMQIIKQALKDYNRQKAEIERLTRERDFYKAPSSELARGVKQIKSEAIKEFATEFEKRCIAGGIYPAFVKRQLENVKKEMVGE